MSSEQSTWYPAEREFSVDEVAEYLGMPARTVRWKAKKGMLRGHKIRVKIWRFLASDVEAFSETLGFRAYVGGGRRGRVA